jgi:hypothetical protein
VKKKQNRVIFCPNQITVVISMALAERDGNRIDTTIIYWPDRCDISKLKKLGITCIPYTGWACINYLIRNIWNSKIEVLLPHRKLGRIMNWFAYLCSKTSIVDDGLDTLRHEPKNVNPKQFAESAHFYTFNYNVKLGNWLKKFTIEKVANFNLLVDVPRKSINLNEKKVLIIESPPLIRVINEIGIDEKYSILVRHSNWGKRELNLLSCAAVNGNEVALEQSVQKFTGDIIVGESMVAVFALMQEKPQYRMTVYLGKENINNLYPLVQLISERPFAKLQLC